MSVDEGATPSGPRPNDGTPPPRNLRILITVGAVVIVGLAVAVGTAGGHRPAPERTGAAAAPTTRAPQASPPAPSSPSPATTGSTSPAPSTPPSVRWHGTLTVSGPDAHEDLDSVPPRARSTDPDLNGDWLTPTLSADSDGVLIAVVSGGGALPRFGRCRDAVVARGIDETPAPLHVGDVTCVITSQGRVARLRMTRATMTSTDPIVTATVTVWDPPQQTHSQPPPQGS